MAEQDERWDAAQEGAELVAEGESAQAIGVLTALLREQPDNEHAYFYLGSAHYELGDYAKALKAYVTALQHAPHYVGAMVHAGHSLRMLGRYNEAIRMGQQVLARVANDPDALYLIGASCFARGDDAKAKQYLELFLQTNPELEVAHEVEGMLQVLRNKIEPIEPPN